MILNAIPIAFAARKRFEKRCSLASKMLSAKTGRTTVVSKISVPRPKRCFTASWTSGRRTQEGEERVRVAELAEVSLQQTIGSGDDLDHCLGSDLPEVVDAEAHRSERLESTRDERLGEIVDVGATKLPVALRHSGDELIALTVK